MRIANPRHLGVESKFIGKTQGQGGNGAGTVNVGMQALRDYIAK